MVPDGTWSVAVYDVLESREWGAGRQWSRAKLAHGPAGTLEWASNVRQMAFQSELGGSSQTRR